MTWNLFKMDISAKSVDAKNLQDLLREYVSINFPIDTADSLKDAYFKMVKIKHNPKTTALWTAFNGNNPNPIIYPIVHAIACELRWAKGEPQHEWILEIGLKEICRTNSFKNGAIMTYKEVIKVINEGKMTTQMLETACWLKLVEKGPILFYDIKDIAIEQGWIKKSKLVVT